MEALLAQLSEDTELHDGLLAAGQRQGSGAAAAVSPTASGAGKRKISEETPAPEPNKAAKTTDKVSPQSVTSVE